MCTLRIADGGPGLALPVVVAPPPATVSGTTGPEPVLFRLKRAIRSPRSFFTVGPDEVRQWTIREGTKAPQAAGVIHTDFEKTFIQAVAFNFNVLKELGDESEVKAKGKVTA